MTVSIIIPTTLRGSSTVRAVQSAANAAAQLPGAELLVAIDRARAGGAAFRPSTAHTRLVHSYRPGAAAARNVALRAASHPVVLFTDDDCIVPVDWCASLAQPLLRSDVAAVAAPVDVVIQGPVTAYLDYQRPFDAPPSPQPGTVRYPITANCALHRGRLPRDLMFDEATFTSAGGEDAELGQLLDDSDIPIAWQERPRVRHVLAERLDEITERSLRYGRASARLYRRCGRWDESVPRALDWYSSLAHGAAVDRRRFRELTEPLIATRFALYEQLAVAAWLVGYLQEMERDLDTPLIDVDEPGLAEAWRRAVDDLNGSVPEPDSWTALGVDLDRLAAPRGHGDGSDHPAPVARALARHAPLRPGVPAGVRAELDRWAPQFDLLLADLAGRARSAWRVLRERPRDSREALARVLRDAGLTFRDGLHDVERMAAPPTPGGP